MGQYGIVIGVALLLVVTGVALGLGAQAARSIARFREDRHTSFLERKRS